MTGVSDIHGNGSSAAVAAEVKMEFVDFWPSCLFAEEGFLNVSFERFDILVPKANSWLRQHPTVQVLKCETLERRISSAEELTTPRNSPSCELPDPERTVYFVKGLRVWFGVDVPASRSHASQIGYRNYVPRFFDLEGPNRYSCDDLSTFYEVVNQELLDRPLEGKIITVETVPLKLSCAVWADHLEELQVDQTALVDHSSYNVFYFTRVYYLFECPRYEQIGASDFLPDKIDDISTDTVTTSSNYAGFSSIFVKVNSWLDKIQDIRITNIQTLETSSHNPDRVNTGLNFLTDVGSNPLVRFVRITYVRPKYGLPPGGLYAPKVATYRSFVPTISTMPPDVNRCERFEEIDPKSKLWSRAKDWLNKTDHVLLCAEVFQHPVDLIETRKDEGESSTIGGLWRAAPNTDDTKKGAPGRVPMVECIRIYYDAQLIKPQSVPESSELPMTSHAQQSNGETKQKTTCVTS